MIDVYSYTLKALEIMIDERKKDRIKAFEEFNKRYRGGDEPGLSDSLIPVNPINPNITGGKNAIDSRT